MLRKLKLHVLFFIKYKGEFLRVKTNTNGQSFSLYFDYLNSIATVPGTKYATSFYSLFNCPKAGCNLAQDTISVNFKEGSDGVYREVYKIVGKGGDDRWSRNSFTYVATTNRLYVGYNSVIYLYF